MKKFFTLILLTGLLFVLTACSTNTDDKTTYTLSDIEAHASETDCWMAIDGKVYDFTEYIPEHPAGKSMVKYCGTEASEAYTNVEHTEYADSLFEPYYLGEYDGTN